MRWLNILRQANHLLSTIEEWLLVIIVLTMVFLAFLQVLLRGVFSMGILWSDIFLRHLVLWVGFIGASLATKDEKHINIDLFGRMLPPQHRQSVQGIIYLFSFIISVFLTSAAWRFMLAEKSAGSILFAQLPTWWFQIIIPVGFGLMSLRFLFCSIEKFVGVFMNERNRS